MDNDTKKIKSFTDLNAWKEAHKLVLIIYKITKDFPKDFINVANQAVVAHKLLNGLIKKSKDIKNSKLKIQNSDKNGFTLFELLIVMAIISIMSAVVISGYSNYKNTKALPLGEKQIINDIRNIQGKTYNILKTNGNFPRGGYGIRFSKNSDNYIIFADDAIPPVLPNKICDGGEKIETVELSGNIKVSNLKKNGSDVAGPVDIVFQPPYGKIFIDGSEKSGGSFIKLEIEITNGINTRIIEVNSSRMIK